MSDEPFLTTDEAALRLRLKRSAIIKLILGGKLPATRYPGTRRWLIRESDIKKRLVAR